ncbi:hypothetical protein [Bradyrhizobium sp. USDA 4449]
MASLIAADRIRDGRSRRANSLERCAARSLRHVIPGSGAASNTIEEVPPGEVSLKPTAMGESAIGAVDAAIADIVPVRWTQWPNDGRNCPIFSRSYRRQCGEPPSQTLEFERKR